MLRKIIQSVCLKRRRDALLAILIKLCGKLLKGVLCITKVQVPSALVHFGPHLVFSACIRAEQDPRSFCSRQGLYILHLCSRSPDGTGHKRSCVGLIYLVPKLFALPAITHGNLLSSISNLHEDTGRSIC